MNSLQSLFAALVLMLVLPVSLVAQEQSGSVSTRDLSQQIEAGQAAKALAELREVERSDPDGRGFARFKTHDDATCFYARLDDL